jgi:hypothetical protein
MPSKHIQTGDIVMSADGKDLGIVKQLGDTCFRIAAPRRRDYWLSKDAIEGRDKGIAVLLYDSDRLDDAFVDVLNHSGAHSHPKQSSPGGASLLKPLFMLGGIGLWALRDKDRREKVFELSKKAAVQLKTKMKRKDDAGEAPWQSSESTPGYSATSTFTPSAAPTPPPPAAHVPAPPPVASPPSPTLTHPPSPPRQTESAISSEERDSREAAVIEEVTKAFPAMNLRVSPISVHTLEGQEVQTLRFTLDETASSDVQLDTLARSGANEQDIAEEIIRDLRLQLPTPPPQT